MLRLPRKVRLWQPKSSASKDPSAPTGCSQSLNEGLSWLPANEKRQLLRLRLKRLKSISRQRMLFDSYKTLRRLVRDPWTLLGPHIKPLSKIQFVKSGRNR